MSEDEITALRLRIEGSVQGVGYRVFAMEEAERLGLDGWVRNLADGSVEALVSGRQTLVEAFVGACMKGPPGARVASVGLLKDEPPAQKGFRRYPSV